MVDLKKRFKLGFNIFLYASLIFLAYYLYKEDFLSIPRGFHRGWMVSSIGVVFIGMLFNSIQWVPLLGSQGIRISYYDSIRTFGMAVFGKYIPGKIWVHLGKSAQIAHTYNLPLVKVSEVSFFSQIITLCIGALSGLIFLISIEKYDLLFWAFLVFFIISGLTIFTKGMQNIGSYLIKRILKKEFVFSSLRPTDFLKVLPFYFISIFSYSLGFLFFMNSVGVNNLEFSYMFIFPLAMTIGVVAIIVPGGLGVREMVISTLLIELSISIDVSNYVSVASRLWFLLAEIFIFLLGFSLNTFSKTRLTKPFPKR